MKEIIYVTVTGLSCGAVFALLKLPIPAPPTIAGIMGIVGIFVGYFIVNYLR